MEASDEEIAVSVSTRLGEVGLTERELQILRHLALGKGDKQIAIELLISVKTVNHHVSSIVLKLDAKNRTHAVAKALLTRQIAMRSSDAPAAIFNRRVNDRQIDSDSGHGKQPAESRVSDFRGRGGRLATRP